METLKNDTTLLSDNSKMEAYVSEKVLSQFNIELLSRSIVGEPIWAKASKEDQSNLTAEMSVFLDTLSQKHYQNMIIKP